MMIIDHYDGINDSIKRSLTLYIFIYLYISQKQTILLLKSYLFLYLIEIGLFIASKL
jgi:hypothetical protein